MKDFKEWHFEIYKCNPQGKYSVSEIKLAYQAGIKAATPKSCAWEIRKLCQAYPQCKTGSLKIHDLERLKPFKYCPYCGGPINLSEEAHG